MWLLILTYCCLLIFAIGLVWRIIRYAGLPLHLRWELYPVAHEKRRPYGGSYLEDLDWWHRPLHFNLHGEFIVFMREILFFREYFKSKRGFWYFVYPFHLGLFLLLAWLVLLVIGAIVQIFGYEIATASNNAAIFVLYYLTIIVGALAFIFGIFGTTGLLIKRLADAELKSYTDPIDYFNLVCILAIFLLGFFSWFIEMPAFDSARSYIAGLFLFKPGQLGILTIIFACISLLFLAYMPFTRMMHYVAKYYTYHKVRWDDEPNMHGSKLEGKIKKLLTQQGTWSASHIKPNANWIEQTEATGISEEKK